MSSLNKGNTYRVEFEHLPSSAAAWTTELYDKRVEAWLVPLVQEDQHVGQEEEELTWKKRSQVVKGTGQHPQVVELRVSEWQLARRKQRHSPSEKVTIK